MNEEKRAYSWSQFVESGFDGRNYKFPTFEGTYDATLSCKYWGKRKNLIAYLDLDDGSKIITSAWQSEGYHGLADLPMGSRVRVTFVKSANGNSFLRSVEEC